MQPIIIYCLFQEHQPHLESSFEHTDKTGKQFLLQKISVLNEAASFAMETLSLRQNVPRAKKR